MHKHGGMQMPNTCKVARSLVELQQGILWDQETSWIRGGIGRAGMPVLK